MSQLLPILVRAPLVNDRRLVTEEWLIWLTALAAAIPEPTPPVPPAPTPTNSFDALLKVPSAMLITDAAGVPAFAVSVTYIRAIVDPLIATAVEHFHRGSGSPETVVEAPIGDLYVDITGGGGPNLTLYVKETSPTPSTGWVAK